MENENIESKKNSKIVSYLIVGMLGIMVVLFLTYYLVPKVLVTLTNAAPSKIVSIDSSYLLGDKLLAKADGQDKAVVNVFVMSKEGKGVSGKEVSLRGLSKIEPVSQITDGQGKAVFRLTSTTETQDKLTAIIDGVEMNKTVTVTFRN